MIQATCIFCKIIAKTAPAKVIEETAEILVIQDIAPQAPIHYLIIPKYHVANICDIPEGKHDMAGALLMMAKKLSQKIEINDFKLIINNGAGAGQVVFHLHCHFLAGKSMKHI